MRQRKRDLRPLVAPVAAVALLLIGGGTVSWIQSNTSPKPPPVDWVAARTNRMNNAQSECGGARSTSGGSETISVAAPSSDPTKVACVLASLDATDIVGHFQSAALTGAPKTDRWTDIYGQYTAVWDGNADTGKVILTVSLAAG